MHGFDQFATLLLNRLLWTSLQAIVLVGVIALVLRLPRLPAAARCALWWVVALQVVLGLAWQSPIRLPLLSPSAAVATQADRALAPTDSTNATGATATAGLVVHGQEQRISWREGLLALWIIGVLTQLPPLVAERRHLRNLLNDSRSADSLLQEHCDELARAAGLRRCPQLRVSGHVVAPMVAGWWRPVILWPDESGLSPDETQLALTHELAHLKRGDLWFGIVPALARVLLFFHPLVRWAVHEYAAYREAACDAVAMHGHDDRVHRAYGALLLRLGVSNAHVAGISAASGTFRNLKLRLAMLRQPAALMMRARTWILVVGVAILGALPYRIGVAHEQVSASRVSASDAAGVGATPSASCDSADDVPFCGAHFLVYMGAVQNGRGAVLFDRNNVIITGAHADVVAAKRFYRPGARLLWFRDGDHAYVVRDPALLARADVLLASVPGHHEKTTTLSRELGEQNLRLAMLDRRAGQLSQKLGELHDRQASLDRDGEGADPKIRTDMQAREAQMIVQLRAQQAQVHAMQHSMDALQVEMLRWQQTSSDEFKTLRTGMGNLVNDALAHGVGQELDQ